MSATSGDLIEIVDWDVFQHRDPQRSKGTLPWVKSFTSLLSADEYVELSFRLRGIYHDLVLEYARANKKLPADCKKLSWRLSQRVTRRDLEALRDAGWIRIVASNPASNFASPSREEQRREEESRAQQREIDTSTSSTWDADEVADDDIPF